MLSDSPHRVRATWILLGCCVLWGLSFPFSKAIEITQRTVLPQASSWFLATQALAARFGLAALLLALANAHTLRRITRLEVQQGLGIGFFGGIGIVLQIDGLAYTSASTSAFLTASYVVIVPLLLALKTRRVPSWPVLLACAIAMSGMAVLSGIDWAKFQIGRGEAETILGSCVFALQILWLERPRFAGNNTLHSTVVMFTTTTFVCLPVALATQQNWSDWGVALRAPAVPSLILALTLLCTLVTFTMMNRWQRHVGATAAGLIYATEPIFTSLCAFFLPGWLSTYGGFQYPNEELTRALLLGGVLITLANLVLLLPAARAGSSGLSRAEGG
ncbi:MAG: DMT family transporter [Verrucomicrobia bacterium]|nr:DMT family transporter [Verrucomicrobiota bacterium]